MTATTQNTTTERIESSVKALDSLTLSYDLLAVLDSDDTILCYDLRAVVRDSGTEESAYAPDIARTLEDARAIFRVMSNALVTPCTFFEILDELL